MTDGWIKLACGCHATPLSNRSFRIEAEAFLCNERHRQGQIVVTAAQPSPRDEGKPAEGKAG